MQQSLNLKAVNSFQKQAVSELYAALICYFFISGWPLFV